MCPLGALHIYLWCMQSPSRVTLLCFSTRTGIERTSVFEMLDFESALSEAIRDTYYTCYICMHGFGAGGIIWVNPLSILRVVVPSWAEIARILTSGICHAANWKTDCVFAKHCHLNKLTGQSFKTQIFKVAHVRRYPSKPSQAKYWKPRFNSHSPCSPVSDVYPLILSHRVGILSPHSGSS